MLPRNALSSCRSVCSARRLQKRTITRSLATLTEASNTPSTSSSNPSPPVQKYDPALPKSSINTSVILTRSPMITRTPTPFERAYYAYQSRIQRALFTHFPTEFYFKQGSLLEGTFVKQEEEREREAFGSVRPQRNTGASEEGTDGVTAKPASTSEGGGAISEDEMVMPRITEADRTGDVRSLDREGERNLYLLVHGGDKVWRFPQGSWKDGELLHEAAERDLKAQCGVNMDTWIVSKNPIGVYEPQSPATSPAKSDASQTYVFFYKAHILAGQVKPDDKNVTDFAWLTKQEIQQRVDQKYWEGVKDMLSDF